MWKVCKEEAKEVVESDDFIERCGIFSAEVGIAEQAVMKVGDRQCLNCLWEGF